MTDETFSDRFPAITLLLFDCRGLPHPLLDHALLRGPPALPARAGDRPAAPEGLHRRVEAGVPVPVRHRHRLRRRLLQRRPLLQHYNRLVSKLLCSSELTKGDMRVPLMS